MIPERHNSRLDNVTAPAALPSDPLSDDKLPNVVKNSKQKENIVCLTRTTVDVDINVKQATEDFFAKSEFKASARIFPPEVIPEIVSSLDKIHLMKTSPGYHHRICFTLRILQDFMDMYRVNYVTTR